MAHDHHWIDITEVQSALEIRKCVSCGLEQCRPLIGFMEGPQLPGDELLDWEDCSPDR